MNSVYVNGIKIFIFSSKEEIIQYAAKEKKCLIAINADKILHATDQTRSIINQNIGYADGIGAVFALRQKGFKDAIKIPGCELWLDIIRNYYKSRSFYLIGSSEEIIKLTVKKLKSEFPGINIIGYNNGYMNSGDKVKHIANTITLNKPDIIFVAMGSPKQEIFIDSLQRSHSAIYQGLGGSFDIYTGHSKRAPNWWIKNNLEGAYRLFLQPYKIMRFIKAIPFWWNLLIGKYK